MVESKFLLAVVRADGTQILLKPGGQGERDIKVLVMAKMADKLPKLGIGVFRTTAHVLADIDLALTEALAEAAFELKSDILPVY